MMRVGEDTGTLDMQLEIAAEYYGQELEYKLKRLTVAVRAGGHHLHGLRSSASSPSRSISAMYGVFNSSKMLNTGPKK